MKVKATLYLAGLLISAAAVSSCIQESDKALSTEIKSFAYNYGYHSGTLTIAGSSILDSGMFTLVDAHKSTVDTSYGKYIMFAKHEELVGVSTDFHTIIFTIYKDLDSGYLFNEKTIKMYNKKHKYE